MWFERGNIMNKSKPSVPGEDVREKPHGRRGQKRGWGWDECRR